MPAGERTVPRRPAPSASRAAKSRALRVLCIPINPEGARQGQEPGFRVPGKQMSALTHRQRLCAERKRLPAKFQPCVRSRSVEALSPHGRPAGGQAGGPAVGNIFPLPFAVVARREGAARGFAAVTAWAKPVVGVVGEKQGAPAGFVRAKGLNGSQVGK